MDKFGVECRSSKELDADKTVFLLIKQILFLQVCLGCLAIGKIDLEPLGIGCKPP